MNSKPRGKSIRPDLKKPRPTSPALAAMRRKHGGTWNIVYVVEGHDEEFVMYVGAKHSRTFAIAATEVQAAHNLGCECEHVHIVSIEKG